MSDTDAVTSAIQKLDAFFQTLDPDEQAVISEMVRSSLLGVAEKSEEEVGAYAVLGFVGGITGANAPVLVSSMGLPPNFIGGTSMPGGPGTRE